MLLYDLFIGFYGRLRLPRIFPFWILTPVRKITRILANIILPQILQCENSRRTVVQTNVIVSLTSFPDRINEVWMVIKCMLNQTYCPSKIILWLSEDQFKSFESLPKSLLALQGDIFQIRLVKGDLRSHKKFYYVSQEFPNSLILLVDDDIYYPSNMIQELLAVHENHPSAVVCRYAYHMKYDTNGVLLPYTKWVHVISNSFTDNHLFFGSGGGTLFTPNDLFKDLLNKDLFLALTPLADDIWLNAMAKLSQLPVIVVRPRLLLTIERNNGKMMLYKENVNNGRNDKQLKAVSEYYMHNFGIDPFKK